MQFLRFFTLCLLSVSLTHFSTAQKPGAYKCLDFDGSDDYVQISDHSSLNPTGAITVEAWIKADAYGRNVYDNSIFCKHGWGRGNQGYVLRCGDNGKLSFNIADAGGTWQEAASASLMDTGIWYHVAGSFDGDSVNIYINGELVGTRLVNTSISTSTGLTARIGDLAMGGGRRFDGMIDEVRVWSRAVSQDNIRDWMCRKVTSSHPDYSGLAAYWNLDEDSGTNAADGSGNANDGTHNNGPVISLSEAALGSVSAYTYSAGKAVLTTRYGDEVTISNITGSPKAFHVYADYDLTEQPLPNGSTGRIDSTHYFGVYYPADTGVKFTFSYDFGAKKGLTLNDKCGVDLYTKSSGYRGSWANSGATFHASGDSMTLTNQTRMEYLAILIETDSNKLLSSNTGKFTLCGTDKLTLIAPKNDSFTYTWYRNGALLSGSTSSTLIIDSATSYKVKITRNGTTCSFESKTVNVTRLNKPKVTFLALKNLCESVDTLKLGGVTPTGGEFSGTGVVGNVFLPSQVRNGTYTISYTYTDTNACSTTEQQSIQVYALPSLNPTGTLEFCNDKDSVKLDHINPKGGTYSGDYISNNYFHIDSANRVSKLYAFRYSYTDANGCTNTYDDSLEVKWATPCTLAAIDTACENDPPITLVGTPVNGVFSGKGVTGSTFDPSIAGKGDHLVTYSFTNLLNCVTTATQSVHVLGKQPVSWSESVNTCSNVDTLHLKEGVPSGGYFTGPGMDSTGVFRPGIPGRGNHTLSYVSIDSRGCHNKANIVAIVHDTTAIDFSFPKAICPLDAPFALNLASPSGGEYSGTGVMNDTLYPRLAGPGKHAIKYSYLDPNYCKNNPVAVLEILAPDSTSIADEAPLCTNADAVVLQLYPSGGTAEGKGVIGQVFSPQLAKAGNHKIIYRYTGSNGCVGTDSTVISVADVPQVELPELPGICADAEQIKLLGGLPSDSGVYSINGQTLTHFDPKQFGPGSYNVQYKVVSFAGCSDSAFTELRVHEVPNKPIITLDKNILVSSATEGNQWLNKAGRISGATNQRYEPLFDGAYWVTVTNDSGCVTISDSFNFMFVSVSELQVIGLEIYPNPSTDGIFKLGGPLHMRPVGIYDVQGRRLDLNWHADSRTLDLSTAPSGVYTLVIDDFANRLLYTRIIKE